MTTTNNINLPQIVNALHVLRELAYSVHDSADAAFRLDGMCGNSREELLALLVKLGREAYATWKDTKPLIDALDPISHRMPGPVQLRDAQEVAQ